MNDEKTLNKIEMRDNQYGGFTPAPAWLITSVLTPGKIHPYWTKYTMNGNQCGGFTIDISSSIEQGKNK